MFWLLRILALLTICIARVIFRVLLIDFILLVSSWVDGMLTIVRLCCIISQIENLIAGGYMKHIIGAIFLIIGVLSFIGLVSVSGATLYVAVTNGELDNYARQFGLIVIFFFGWLILLPWGLFLVRAREWDSCHINLYTYFQPCLNCSSEAFNFASVSSVISFSVAIVVNKSFFWVSRYSYKSFSNLPTFSTSTSSM